MPKTDAPQAHAPSTGWYVVALCMIAFVFSYTDRQILSLLIDPIRKDLGLTDTQFGLLHGFAFSLFYATLGLPVATLSDRMSRPLIIAVGIATWSVATVTCGFARNFTQMLMSRMMVGAGEGTLTPATYSLISDLFAKGDLGKATAVYSLGSFLGSGLALVVCGAVIAMLGVNSVDVMGIATLHPWQLTLVIVGLPGLLLALLIVLTVRDPRRLDSPKALADKVTSATPVTPDFTAVFRLLIRERAIFGPHLLGYSLFAMALFGLLAWSPAFLIRVHGMPPQEAGYWLGSTAIVFGGAGVLTSGWWMDRRMRRGAVDGPFRMGVIGALGLIVPVALLPFSHSNGACLALLAIAMFFSSFPMPPSAAVIQIVVPANMRSRVSAIFLFFNSLFGLTLGSVLIGLLNDRVFGRSDAVGISMSIVVVIAAALAALVLATGMGPFRARLSPYGHES